MRTHGLFGALAQGVAQARAGQRDAEAELRRRALEQFAREQQERQNQMQDLGALERIQTSPSLSAMLPGAPSERTAPMTAAAQAGNAAASAAPGGAMGASGSLLALAAPELVRQATGRRSDEVPPALAGVADRVGARYEGSAAHRNYNAYQDFSRRRQDAGSYDPGADYGKLMEAERERSLAASERARRAALLREAGVAGNETEAELFLDGVDVSGRRAAQETARDQRDLQWYNARTSRMNAQRLGSGVGGGTGGGGSLRQAPPAVIQSVIDNTKMLGTIDSAIEGVNENPTVVGFRNSLGMAAIRDRTSATPKDIQTRAAIGDIGSMIINDRSGAAVTAAEMPRLRPFIPQITDPSNVVVEKLRRMRDIIAEETALLQANYGAENGYRPINTGRPLPQGGDQAGIPVPTAGSSGDVDLRTTEHPPTTDIFTKYGLEPRANDTTRRRQ